jgi:glycosyltransferase involved in cell wall biosynthesis
LGYKLSILIPTLASREQLLRSLVEEFKKQDLTDVEIVPALDNGEMTIGFKRNWLLEQARGEYVAFFDDDDLPGLDYIKHAMEGINKGVDCVSLRGVITWNGDNPEVFEHSIKYDSYRTNDTGFPKYERYPNHLNVIKASIAKQFKFPEINHGEDTDWATQIKRSGLIKTEHYVDSVTYHYRYITNK